MGRMNWNHIVQEWDQWWALVNVASNIWVPLNVGNSCVSVQLLTSQRLRSAVS
jgi:hypothetical protein